MKILIVMVVSFALGVFKGERKIIQINKKHRIEVESLNIRNNENNVKEAIEVEEITNKSGMIFNSTDEFQDLTDKFSLCEEKLNNTEMKLKDVENELDTLKETLKEQEDNTNKSGMIFNSTDEFQDLTDKQEQEYE